MPLTQQHWYCFHAPGLQLDNEVSQSTDQLHGTVCHQHYGHRTCRSAFKRALKTHLHVLDRPAPLIWDVFMTGAAYKYPDLLTAASRRLRRASSSRRFRRQTDEQTNEQTNRPTEGQCCHVKLPLLRRGLARFFARELSLICYGAVNSRL